MSATRDPTRSSPNTETEGPVRVEETTLELHEAPDGTWTATQEGVDVVGEGPAPIDATIHYCEQLRVRLDGGAS